MAHVSTWGPNSNVALFQVLFIIYQRYATDKSGTS